MLDGPRSNVDLAILEALVEGAIETLTARNGPPFHNVHNTAALNKHINRLFPAHGYLDSTTEAARSSDQGYMGSIAVVTDIDQFANALLSGNAASSIQYRKARLS